MKELFFRGKDLKTGRWLYGDLYHDRVLTYITCWGPLLHEAVITDTIGAYTGVLDKNSNKIFEHDIVKVRVKGEEGLGVVIYDNGAFMVADIKGNVGWNTLWEYYYNDWDLEIVGNKHDNPEMLDVEDIYDRPEFQEVK